MTETKLDYIPWLRSKIGHTKFFLVAGGVLLRDKTGRVLLEHRADFDLLGVPGGMLEIEETIEQAARRELKEETGMEAGHLELVGIYSEPKWDVTYPNGDQSQQFTILFTGLVSGGEIAIDSAESIAAQWFEPENIPYDNMLPWFEKMVRDALYEDLPVLPEAVSSAETIDQIKLIRSLIGTERFIGCGSMGAIVREDGRLLATRRSDIEDVWCLPGGFSDLGENYVTTGIREVLEETGLEVAVERLVGIATSPEYHTEYPNGDKVKSVITVLRCRVIGGELAGHDGEVAEFRWVTPEELGELTKTNSLNSMYRLIGQHIDAGYFIN